MFVAFPSEHRDKAYIVVDALMYLLLIMTLKDYLGDLHYLSNATDVD